jgi:hypothetical protein
MSDLHKKLLKDNPAFRHLPPRPPVPNENSGSSSINLNKRYLFCWLLIQQELINEKVYI